MQAYNHALARRPAEVQVRVAFGAGRSLGRGSDCTLRQARERIHRSAAHPHLEVEVRPGRVAGRTDEPDPHTESETVNFRVADRVAGPFAYPSP